MTFPVVIDPGLIAGVCGTLGGLVCLLALRRHRTAVERTHAALRSEMRSMLLEHKVECAAGSRNVGRREAALIAKVARILSPQ